MYAEEPNFKGMPVSSAELSALGSVALLCVSSAMDEIVLTDVERTAEGQELLWTGPATGGRKLLYMEQ